MRSDGRLAMLDGPALCDERVRALADELLQRPRYAAYRDPNSPLREIIDRLADGLRNAGDWLPDWLGEFWESIRSAMFSFLEGLLGDEPLAILVRFVLAGAVLAVSAGVLATVVRALRDSSAGGEPAPLAQPPASEAIFLARAEGLAEQGRFLEAAHCTQLAALQLLLRGEWLTLERSDPNRTLRRRLLESPLPDAERSDFLVLLDRLESRWFRDRVEDRDLYGAWRGLHSRLASAELTS